MDKLREFIGASKKSDDDMEIRSELIQYVKDNITNRKITSETSCIYVLKYE